MEGLVLGGRRDNVVGLTVRVFLGYERIRRHPGALQAVSAPEVHVAHQDRHITAVGAQPAFAAAAGSRHETLQCLVWPDAAIPAEDPVDGLGVSAQIYLHLELGRRGLESQSCRSAEIGLAG